MDYQKPDLEQGPLQQGMVENDFVRPLTPMRSVSHRRLPAALPFAIAGILVVSSIAFGATVIRNSVTPPPDASGVVVGDDPTDTPTATVTITPTATPSPTDTLAPTPVTPLVLTGALSGTKVSLQWTQYTGDDFAYYKVVRSTNASVSWPLGDGDTLVAAISDIATLSFLDSAPLGQTFTYEVFAVKSSDDAYAVLVGSNTQAVTTPEPTPAPTQPKQDCSISLSVSVNAPKAFSGDVQPATVKSSGYSVTLNWTKYQCANFDRYGVYRVEGTGAPTIKAGQTPSLWYSDPQGNADILTMTDKTVQAGKTYTYVVIAYSESKLGNTGQVVPACEVVTILAISNDASATIPAAVPTPTPVVTPTPTPVVTPTPTAAS